MHGQDMPGMRSMVIASALAILAIGSCSTSDEFGTSETTIPSGEASTLPPDSTESSAPRSSSAPISSSTLPTESPLTTILPTTTMMAATSASTLPGVAIEGFPRRNDILAVMGVRHDDVLNIRAAPGADQQIVAKVAPTADNLVATGRVRSLPGSIWYEVDVDEMTGWANSSLLAFPGGTDDATALFLTTHPATGAATMAELGELVAAGFASVDPNSRLVQSVASTVGDLGEVTYDVVGLGDDSLAAYRLHVFAVPNEGDDGFLLRTIERMVFCWRGVDDGICI